MKKTYSIAFSVLVLCSLLLVGTVQAYQTNPIYSYGEYGGFTNTLDGKWTTGTEWMGAPWQNLSGTAKFSGNIDIVTGTYQWNIFELTSDTTNDAGDYFSLAMCNLETGPATPTTDCYRWDIVGHTTLRVYQGNGTGWSLLATPAPGFAWNNTLSASPISSTPHQVYETRIDKAASPINAIPPIGIRVAFYDASNTAAGEQAWPPNSISSINNPSQWGSISGYVGDGPVPESLSVAVAIALSSVAVIVGSVYLRKRPKTTIITPIKL